MNKNSYSKLKKDNQNDKMTSISVNDPIKSIKGKMSFHFHLKKYH